MALSPQKFREIVLQILYSQEISKTDDDLMIELLMNELEVSKKNIRSALEKAQLIHSHLTEIDQLISDVSTSYDFDRIQLVSKNILRLGVYELKYDDTIPPKVAIAESIRLSRKFCSPESSTFVNAILDQIYRNMENGKND